MKFVSLGSNCDVATFIKQAFKQETYPFDWLFTNIDFIINTFEKNYHEFTECEKLNPVFVENCKYTYIFNNGCKGETERICSAVSVHDADYTNEITFPEKISTINEKYKRRFKRLYELFENTNEKIIFIRKLLDKEQGAVKKEYDTVGKINQLFDLIQKKCKTNFELYIVDTENSFSEIDFSNPKMKKFATFEEIYKNITQPLSTNINPFITVNLMGGLGNQLFQIFATIAHGIKYNYRVIFNYSDTLTVGKVRPTYWGNLLNSLSVFTTANIEHGVTANDIGQWPKYSYMEHSFQEIPQMPPGIKGATLEGYFQSHKYFADHIDEILQLIRIEEMKEGVREEFAELFATSDMNASGLWSISMHFRRGDYKNFPLIHPILPIEYYRKALEYLLSKNEGMATPEKGHEEIRVFVFCEEEDTRDVFDQIRILRREFLSRGHKIQFIKVADGEADWKQLMVMSMCRSNIIANSSFSWWGAYLNSNSERVVIYPSIWFGPKGPVVVKSDMFPFEKWVEIDW
jgi:hypothetical protein